MENWDTSLVTVMNAAFNSNVSFNGDISGWDTSKVTDMGTMFFGASTFNQDLSRWNITNVVDMAAMFSGARAFNQDISKWVTSKLTNMSFMFEGASAFNQDLSGWNTSKVTDMAGMFKNAVAFDQEIRGWDVSKVGRFTNMFDGATAFAATYGTVPGFGATPTAAFFTPSSDATLSALTLSQGSLSPSFVSSRAAYNAGVIHATSYNTVTPTVNDPGATVTVNGAPAATPVNLAVGGQCHFRGGHRPRWGNDANLYCDSPPSNRDLNRPFPFRRGQPKSSQSQIMPHSEPRAQPVLMRALSLAAARTTATTSGYGDMDELGHIACDRYELCLQQ